MVSYQHLQHVCMLAILTGGLAAPRRKLEQHLVPCLATECPQNHERIKKRSINPEDVHKSPDEFTQDIESNKADGHPDGSDVIGQHKTQLDLSRDGTVISADSDEGSVERQVEEPDVELAVHGTAYVHDHDVPETNSSRQIGTVLPDQEAALHDTKNVHSAADRAEHDADTRLNAMAARSTDVDPDEMLHGSGSDHFHSDDDAGLSGGLLPPPDAPSTDWMVTVHHTRLGVARDDEKDDFLAWKSSADAKSADTVMKGGSWLWRGFSFPFISDTIDDDETVMKKRYLTRIEEAINGAEVDKLDAE